MTIRVEFDYWLPSFGELRVVADVIPGANAVEFVSLTNASNGRDQINRPMSGLSRALLLRAAIDYAHELWGERGDNDRAAEEAGDLERESA